MFPVEVAYLKEPVVDYVQAAVDTVFNIHLRVSWVERPLPDIAGTSRRRPCLPDWAR